jgi:RND superfamily putative drug exporter
MLAFLVLPGVLTSDMAFTGNPESKRADEIIAEYFPESTAVGEVAVVTNESVEVDGEQFRDYASQLRENILALGEDIIDTETGITDYYTLNEQADTFSQQAQGLYVLATTLDTLSPEQRAPILEDQGLPTSTTPDELRGQARQLEDAVGLLRSGAEELVSEDRHTLLMSVTMMGTVGEASDSIEQLRHTSEEVEGEGFEVLFTGDASVNHDMLESSEKDIRQGESIGVPVALIILAIVFGTVVAAVVPMLLGLAAIGAALGIVALIGQAAELPFVIQSIISMLGLAVGIDYSLFIVSRYREELREGHPKLDAIATAGSTASRAVLFSGMTVVLAVVALLFVPTTMHLALGLGAVIVVTMAVVAALTLLPAIMSITGDRINRLKVPFLKEESAKRRRYEKGGFWSWLVENVMNRPALSLILAVALLLACAYPVLHLSLGESGVTGLPEGYQSKDGLAVLEDKFSAGQLAPLKIVVPDYASPGIQEDTEALRAALSANSDFDGFDLEESSSGDVALVTVTLAGDPYSTWAADRLEELRGTLIPEAFSNPGANVWVTGAPATIADFSNVTMEFTPLVFAFVLGLSFLLLMVVFRSVIVPITSILMNLLSVGAAYGLIVLVFQEGVGASLFGFQELESIDAWIPIMLFCVLFGLSMDYHVFLLSRIREHYDQTGDNSEAVAFGIRSTAGLITGAALIMLAVFGGFASGEGVIMQQMGFGLAVAVLMDATIIRCILVPSAMRILGKRNWYFPSWLRWIPDVRVEGRADKKAA